MTPSSRRNHVKLDPRQAKAVKAGRIIADAMVLLLLLLLVAVVLAADTMLGDDGLILVFLRKRDTSCRPRRPNQAALVKTVVRPSRNVKSKVRRVRMDIIQCPMSNDIGWSDANSSEQEERERLM